MKNKELIIELARLVNVGILQNDSLKYINKITHEYIKDTKDYVELTIRREEQL